MRYYTAMKTMTGETSGHKGNTNVIEINDCADKIENKNLKVYDELFEIANENARARRHSNQTIPHNTWTIIQNNLEDWDNGNNYNTETYRFTSVTDGYYYVIGQCMYGTLSGDSQLNMIAVFKNGIRTGIEDDVRGYSGYYVSLQVFGMIYLGVGDYVDIRTFQYSGSTQTLSATGTGETKQWIMVKRVL